MSPHIELQIAVDEDDGLPDETRLRRWIGAALPPERQDVLIGVRIVNETESRALNRDYRHRDRPTNVLSFPYDPPQGIEADFPLGDLVLCAPVIAREARDQGKPLEAHWAHLVIHGTLHLLGHDHINEADARRMEASEIHILTRLGFPDPYRDHNA